MLPISYTIIYRIASIISPSCKKCNQNIHSNSGLLHKIQKVLPIPPPPRRQAAASRKGGPRLPSAPEEAGAQIWRRLNGPAVAKTWQDDCNFSPVMVQYCKKGGVRVRRLLLAVLCLLLFTLPVWGAEAENTMEVTAVVNGGRLLPDGSEARPEFGRPGAPGAPRGFRSAGRHSEWRGSQGPEAGQHPGLGAGKPLPDSGAFRPSPSPTPSPPASRRGNRESSACPWPRRAWPAL